MRDCCPVPCSMTACIVYRVHARLRTGDVNGRQVRFVILVILVHGKPFLFLIMYVFAVISTLRHCLSTCHCELSPLSMYCRLVVGGACVYRILCKPI